MDCKGPARTRYAPSHLVHPERSPWVRIRSVFEGRFQPSGSCREVNARNRAPSVVSPRCSRAAHVAQHELGTGNFDHLLDSSPLREGRASRRLGARMVHVFRDVPFEGLELRPALELRLRAGRPRGLRKSRERALHHDVTGETIPRVPRRWTAPTSASLLFGRLSCSARYAADQCRPHRSPQYPMGKHPESAPSKVPTVERRPLATATFLRLPQQGQP